jgi:hypothetical protein
LPRSRRGRKSPLLCVSLIDFNQNKLGRLTSWLFMRISIETDHVRLIHWNSAHFWLFQPYPIRMADRILISALFGVLNETKTHLWLLLLPVL